LEKGGKGGFDTSISNIKNENIPFALKNVELPERKLSWYLESS
jgi:hypothetical protein